MSKSKLIKVFLIGGSFIAGTVFEKHLNPWGNSNNLLTESNLPIFSRVFAATPFTPTIQDAAKGNRVSQIMKYGFPSLDSIRSFDDYILSYDRRNRVANWVFEHLTKENISPGEGVSRSECQFTDDTSIHPYFRSFNSDYKGSGFDRGHLAAAGNHQNSQKNIEQTFFLSNMAPQVGNGFNRHSWNRLEKHVRKLTKTHKNVYCCTGPLYLPRKEADGKNYIKYQVIGPSNVAVPTHFFKVVVAESASGEFEMEAYVMPNQAIDDTVALQNFQVPPESIERAAGLLFFDQLMRNKIHRINGKKM